MLTFLMPDVRLFVRQKKAFYRTTERITMQPTVRDYDFLKPKLSMKIKRGQYLGNDTTHTGLVTVKN